MSRKFQRLAILAKRDVTYGVDAVPTGAVDAVLAANVSITPFAGEEDSRDLMLPYLGNQGVLLAGTYATVEFDVEISGSGAAGTVPAYGTLLRMCGMSETVVAVTSVTYAPVSSGEESGAIYWNHDGVRHVLLGARGTVTADFTVKKIPRFRFTFTGLLGTITDVAIPAVTTSLFRAPLIVSTAVTTFSLHGAATIMEKLMIDLGNTIEPRFMVGEETIELTGRQSKGSCTVEAMGIATRNWFATAAARTRAALALQHGTVGGNIVQVAAPLVEIGRPTQGQGQGILNYELPLMFVPNAGNDELSFIVR